MGAIWRFYKITCFSPVLYKKYLKDILVDVEFNKLYFIYLFICTNQKEHILRFYLLPSYLLS